MIPTESRMREIRTSGSTSGGVETDRMGAGLSTKRKHGQKHRTLPGTAPPPDSTYIMSCLSYFSSPSSYPMRFVSVRMRHFLSVVFSTFSVGVFGNTGKKRTNRGTM